MAKYRALQIAVFAAFLCVSSGCGETPAPPEVMLAARQRDDLRAAGVSVYAPEEFRLYLDALAAATSRFEQERSRFRWFRNYDETSASFRSVLERGGLLALQVEERRGMRIREVSARRLETVRRLGLLRRLAESLLDRRLAQPRLVQVELLLAQVGFRIDQGRENEADDLMAVAELETRRGVEAVLPILARYSDRGQVGRWRQLVEKGLADSRRSGGDLLVASKVERRLTHYRRGRLVRSYETGMGFNYLSDKLYSGDRATPEGAYRVIRKNPESRFFRALLIDYPNDEDRRRYGEARRRGQIPGGAGIGGLIEIHGGGRDGMTDGCLALDNGDMATLYDQIGLQTPVIIVGTTNHENLIAETLAALQ